MWHFGGVTPSYEEGSVESLAHQGIQTKLK